LSTELGSRTPKAGDSFRLSVLAVEPVADIAVLSPPHSQVFTDDGDAFGEFCERTAPVNVSEIDLGEGLRLTS
jgi:hypothetical protein